MLWFWKRMFSSFPGCTWDFILGSLATVVNGPITRLARRVRTAPLWSQMKSATYWCEFHHQLDLKYLSERSLV
jgi:hypothetical protein